MRSPSGLVMRTLELLVLQTTAAASKPNPQQPAPGAEMEYALGRVRTRKPAPPTVAAPRHLVKRQRVTVKQ